MILNESTLNEHVKQILDSKKFAPLDDSDKMLMESLLTQTGKNFLTENTMTQDVAQFTPILMPLVRRVYPALIANELLGVQPLKTPTGFIYSLRNTYTGDKINGINPHKNGQIVVLEAASTKAKPGLEITQSNGAKGTITHIEPDNKTILLNVTTDNVRFVDGDVTIDNETKKIVGVYTNESTFKKILKNYTGPHTTHAGELLGKDIKEVGIKIDRKSVEAVTRKLRGSYTLEMYEDLKNQHGLLADEELISLMRAELQTEIDREVVDFVNSNATVVPNAYVPNIADGRWEVEKYRVEAIKIANESRKIGTDTKRGAGNIILCSPKVVTMLEQLGSFKTSPYDSQVSGDNAFRGIVGTFDGKKVICDQYAESDYITVLYKGQDRRDAMGFMSVYVPAEFMRVVDPDSGQPGIIMRTRYALATQPIAPEAYARTFGVDFTNSALMR